MAFRGSTLVPVIIGAKNRFFGKLEVNKHFYYLGVGILCFRKNTDTKLKGLMSGIGREGVFTTLFKAIWCRYSVKLNVFRHLFHAFSVVIGLILHFPDTTIVILVVKNA